MIIAERAARVEAEALAARAQAAAVNAEADAANARADLSRCTEALISHCKLEIEKLRRQLYGTRSERTARLLEQMELQLEELEATATEDELAAEQAAATIADHPVVPAQAAIAQAVSRPPAARACGDPGAGQLSLLRLGPAVEKLGEDITETLEVVPRQWKVIQTVREKFSCRACETTPVQPPAPFHVTPRGSPGRRPAGDDPVREVRPASTPEPAE